MFYLNTVTNIWWNKIRRVIQFESAINFVCLCGIHCQNRDNYKMGDIMYAFMVLFCFAFFYSALSFYRWYKMRCWITHWEHMAFLFPSISLSLSLSVCLYLFLSLSFSRQGKRWQRFKWNSSSLNMESMIWKRVFQPSSFQMTHWIQFKFQFKNLYFFFYLWM